MKNMKKGTTPIVIGYVIGIIITILILIAIRYGEYLLIADSLPDFSFWEFLWYFGRR